MTFKGFTERTFSFLMEISFNNSKAFLNEHRDVYEEHVLRPLQALEEAIRDTVLSIDPHVRTGRNAVSRIYRDTRFSKDKSPLRDHMWLGYKHDGEDNAESFGFYFEITPVSYGYGMGSYGTNPAFMNRFREKVAVDPARLERIVTDPAFVATFSLHGEDFARLKAVPHAAQVSDVIRPWVQKKRFYIEHSTNAIQGAMSDALVAELTRGFKTAEPLYRFCHDTERIAQM